MSIGIRTVGFTIALLLGLLVSGAATAATAAPAPDSGDALFSEHGTATCVQCHNEAPATEILKTPHAMKGDAHAPGGQHGCESCHGPSDAHARGFAAGKPAAPTVVFNGPNASPVSVRNQTCIGCHQDAKRMDWAGSAHQNANLACVSCHTMHAAKDPMLVRQTQPDKCFTCHAQQRAESFQYSHHPMREGKVVCADCHNPHGSPGPKLLKEFTVNQTCYTCHADKRGPMLWEHQPVRENCLNCHTPHGSNEARLLKERMNFMCASCHSSTANSSGGAFGGAHSTFGNLAGAATFSSALANNRTCLNCHSQVHGSNSPAGTYFQR
jgi:DmsE family decaheme c-type cytochrome